LQNFNEKQKKNKTKSGEKSATTYRIYDGYLVESYV